MKNLEAVIGKWFIQCIPEDGARISVLQYEGIDLLTGRPADFKPPEMDYGEYETRPVYGYDDCFPSVDPCVYPHSSMACRDHGNICWMKWQVALENNRLTGHVDCLMPKVVFIRTLEFQENSLNWKFEVINHTDAELPFLHVMHALMPLEEIRSIELPEFFKIIDENTSKQLDIKDPENIALSLLNLRSGTFAMLLLKGVKQDQIHLVLKKGLTLKISFNRYLFPTIGIWWNNCGYPNEDGRQRIECAFEPIPGSTSKLEQAYADGTFLKVEPGRTLKWEINWQIQKK